MKPIVKIEANTTNVNLENVVKEVNKRANRDPRSTLDEILINVILSHLEAFKQIIINTDNLEEKLRELFDIYKQEIKDSIDIRLDGLDNKLFKGTDCSILLENKAVSEVVAEAVEDDLESLRKDMINELMVFFSESVVSFEDKRIRLERLLDKEDNTTIRISIKENDNY